LPAGSADKALGRLDHYRYASGGTPTAKAARQHAACDAEQLRGVPHRRVLTEGQNLIHKVHGGIGDVSSPTVRWSGIPT
jgi:succinate dehydrogenase / fumarate reductase flavoprotein subunit